MTEKRFCPAALQDISDRKKDLLYETTDGSKLEDV